VIVDCSFIIEVLIVPLFFCFDGGELRDGIARRCNCSGYIFSVGLSCIEGDHRVFLRVEGFNFDYSIHLISCVGDVLLTTSTGHAFDKEGGRHQLPLLRGQSCGFGSVAKGVASQAGCPVLLIPMNAGVPKIKHAAIVFDEVSTLIELSEKTNFLRKALAPAMHFTHVLYRDEVSEDMMKLDLVRKMLNNDFPDYAVDFNLLPEGNVTRTLIDYSLKRDIDLLILGRHSRGFLMNLLVKSEIPDIVGSCDIPMLVIPLN
jgi:hypothetical protein